MPTPAPCYDVAVVGAGPAGACAAATLARAGCRVVLLEAQALPRYKTCGGGVLGRATCGMAPLLGDARLADALHADLREAIDAACEDPCHAAELALTTYGTTASSSTTAPTHRVTARRDQPVVHMTMRDRFDAALARIAQRAGAELREQCRVQTVENQPDAVTLDTPLGTVAARWLVAADGANSTVARACGWPAHRRVMPAVEYEVAYPPDQLDPWRGVARFDFGAVPGGYAWVFPKRHHLSIGAGTVHAPRHNEPGDAKVNLHRAVAAYMQRLGLTMPHYDDRGHGTPDLPGSPGSPDAPPPLLQRHGYVIPLGTRSGQLVRGRVLLTGDAAGFADPLTGEGITLAAAAGVLAAHAVLEAFDRPGLAPSAYRRRLAAGLLPELRVADRLAAVMYRWPALRDRLFNARAQALVERVTDIVAGHATYRDAVPSPRRWLAQRMPA